MNKPPPVALAPCRKVRNYERSILQTLNFFPTARAFAFLSAHLAVTMRRPEAM